MLKLKHTLQKLINPNPFDPRADFEVHHHALVGHVKKYTMTSPERIFALTEATKYVIKNNIEGDIVECGLWRG